MRSSRIRQFLLMLPFFLLGLAVPTYLFGFLGDGPPDLTPARYSPVPAISPQPAPLPTQSDKGTPQGSFAPNSGDQRFDGRQRPPGIVLFVRGLFESFVDRYVSQSLSPATIKLGAFVLIFAVSFLLIRVLLVLMTGGVGTVLGFLVHKAAAPMFMGFLAVGSTWGIHQTIAQEFGMSWAATTVSLTAAIASLFALAGVKIR